MLSHPISLSLWVVLLAWDVYLVYRYSVLHEQYQHSVRTSNGRGEVIQGLRGKLEERQRVVAPNFVNPFDAEEVLAVLPNNPRPLDVVEKVKLVGLAKQVIIWLRQDGWELSRDGRAITADGWEIDIDGKRLLFAGKDKTDHLSERELEDVLEEAERARQRAQILVIRDEIQRALERHKKIMPPARD